MAVTVAQAATADGAASPWRGFQTGLWRKEIDVRDFIQQNYEPYHGDERFLAPVTPRTQKIWDTLQALFVEERKKGVLDVSQIPSSITAHAPGYIDKDHEVIVGLQTDAPLKRAIMPNGGLRMVVNALKTYGHEPDPHVVEAFTKYRKTHNDGVFDAYTADIRKCRSSHMLTGLPDAYGRGRIIGDYRRVALYGVDRLIARKQEEKASLDGEPSTDEIIRDREELSEQIRALKELIKMAAAYGFDISGPARTAKEAVQWLYFGYLAGVKEQNGAAMSLGRTSTFLDIYFARDLADGHADRGAGAGDHRRLRHQAAHRPLPAHARVRRPVRRRPDVGHRVDRRHGRRRPDAGHQDELPPPADALQSRPRAGAEPDDLVLAATARRLPRFAAKVAIDTSSLQFESDEIMRRAWGDDGAIACCVSPMLIGKQMQFFGARANLAKCLLYAINGGRDEISGEQIAPPFAPVTGDVPRLRRRRRCASTR